MCRIIKYVVLIYCSSCTIGPSYQQPEFFSQSDLIKELNLHENAILSSDLYENLQDKQLSKLEQIGLKNNTDIQTALSRLRQSRYQLKINQVEFLPQIGLQAGYQYNKSSDNIKMSADSHYYNAGFDALWEMDLWGVSRRQKKADEALVKASEYSLENVKIIVAAEIASNYINWAQSVKKLMTARKNAELQQQILHTVEAKYNNGLTDSIAYNQAQYLLANTKTQIPEFEKQAQIYKNALAVILGVLPSQVPLEFSEVELYAKKTRQLADLPVYVIRLRPDVVAAEQNLIAQNALVGKAIAELYPAVNISALFGYASQGGSKLFNNNSQTYSYTPIISLPLLDWNKLQNNINLQKEQQKEAFFIYKNTVLQAASEVKNAMVSYQNDLRANSLQGKALDNVKKTLDYVLQKYENGLTEFSEVLTSQQNYITAENAFIDGKSQILKSEVAFYKASGAPIGN